ncbi:hypothetical protein EJ04DRAFT_486354 [Polyplosphaeria fusca]|uniref:Uncharacterized protein n=1 Tax=Polyplosphaeria fusca TaxID=682080 RepID=A0A9P4R7W7_9PLEO|nr:hypothetical protein EJ04DRAFT_486354 [Polyplosphaeria fusca]
MAPLRRYLRITKHSVLEVRIYLDRPSDVETWLLKRDNPALPRVIQSVRPLVLPKLREEYERAKGRGSKSKKKGVRDVVVGDDFEVSIFLTEHSSRHSVLTKQKIFKDKPRLQSNSGKLTGWLTAGTSDHPVVVNEGSTETIVLREEDEDQVVDMSDIPEIGRPNSNRQIRGGVIGNASDSDDSLHSDAGDSTRGAKGQKDRRGGTHSGQDEDTQDDKDKLGLNTTYDGFSIYGRILCLVVKRKGSRTASGGELGSSQKMLENWVSTQAAAEQIDDDEENG